MPMSDDLLPDRWLAAQALLLRTLFVTPVEREWDTRFLLRFAEQVSAFRKLTLEVAAQAKAAGCRSLALLELADFLASATTLPWPKRGERLFDKAGALVKWLRVPGAKVDRATTSAGAIKGAKPKAKMPVDARAVGCLEKHPAWTIAQIAEAIGCHPKSLSNAERCPEFTKARRLLKGWKLGMDRGGVDARTGQLDAWTDETELSYIDPDHRR